MNGAEAPWERPLIVLIINIFGGHITEVKQIGGNNERNVTEGNSN